MAAAKKDKINHTIQRELSRILQMEVRDRDLRLCTITDVRVTNDLSIAKVYVSFFKNEKNGMEALTHAAGFIRSLLAKKLTIRKVPELQFILDTSLEKGNAIASIIDDLKK